LIAFDIFNFTSILYSRKYEGGTAMTDTNITLSGDLEAVVIESIEKESAELTRLCDLVSDAAKIR